MEVQFSTLGRDLNTALARAALEERRRRELEEEERKRLEAQAQDLERYRSEFFGQLRDVLGGQEGVRIVGDRFVFYSDNAPLSGLGEVADNWELSQARALSVVRYMVNFLGLPPGRLSANGFGQYQPIAAGDSADARAQNRRIELKFTEK